MGERTMPTLDASTMIPGAPRAGDVLAGKYRVERLLGSGGMGVVALATHLELEQRVAIKLLLPHVAQSQESVERFLREARYAAKIKSEHVVRVLDVARLDSGSPYIVMEFLDGSDLAALISARGPLPVHLAIDLLLQACEAIAEAHALGIVHRDLKPANLFVLERPGVGPLVKVLDFGISKDSKAGADEKHGAITTTTAILGTPSYMSPEQMRSSRNVDGRTDIWSLGAILYSLLAGVPPYEGESTADVCAKIMRDPPEPLSRPDVPRGVAYAIERCLEKSPAKRFESIAILAAALVEFGSPAARASLARIGALPVPSALLPPSTPFESDPTHPAHVVISRPPPPLHTAGNWERSGAGSTGWHRRRPFNLVLGALLAACAGGFVSLEFWGGKGGAGPVASGAPPSTLVVSAGMAEPSVLPSAGPSGIAVSIASPSAAPSATVPVVSIDVTSLPVAPASAVAPIEKVVRTPPAAKPASSALFDGRK
jgi:eukaryotic-like serine/threonine-protein kinase